jgi:YD repeat-containing protein
VIEDPTASITLPGGGTVSNTPVAPATSLTTTYTYDALDDLLTVNQSGLTRTFTYDGAKRLTQAINPESGAPSTTATTPTEIRSPARTRDSPRLRLMTS